jgi:hypothetical protein
MYRVRYYMTGGTLTSKTFPSFHEATVFAVYHAGFQSVYSIDKVD